MADEETALAVTLDEPKETPVNDGIIDLDALEEVKPETTDDEEAAAKADKTDKEPEAKAEGEGDKPKDEKKNFSGSARERFKNARLLEENAELQRRLEAATQAQAEKAGDEKPPREEDFNGDWFEYNRKLTAYEAGKAASEVIAKQFKTREEAEHTTKQAEIARERNVAHLERVEDAREVIADFDKVMKGMDGVKVRNDVIEEIMSSDNSAVIAYHLAMNPQKLDAMNQMSARELAREMGRLEATVKLPEAKKATTAPPPVSSVRGGASPSSAEGDLARWMKKTYG